MAQSVKHPTLDFGSGHDLRVVRSSHSSNLTLKIISIKKKKRIVSTWGIWMAQLVKHLTLGFGSGHDLRVVRWSPVSGSALSGESAGDSFSLSLSLCPSPCLHAPTSSLFLSQINKNI